MSPLLVTLLALTHDQLALPPLMFPVSLAPLVNVESSAVDPGWKSRTNPASKNPAGNGERCTPRPPTTVKMLLVVFPEVAGPQSGADGRAAPSSMTLPSSSKAVLMDAVAVLEPNTTREAAATTATAESAERRPTRRRERELSKNMTERTFLLSNRGGGCWLPRCCGT